MGSWGDIQKVEGGCTDRWEKPDIEGITSPKINKYLYLSKQIKLPNCNSILE